MYQYENLLYVKFLEALTIISFYQTLLFGVPFLSVCMLLVLMSMFV